MKISAVVLTKNEEENIKDCLVSLKWCNEIVILDDQSTDKTLDILKKFDHKNLQVVEKTLEDFSGKRNFALGVVKEEWVLFVDADERVSEALAWEISNLTFEMQNKHNGFFIRRKDFMWGKELKHGESGNLYLLRLAKKEAGAWEGKVHEKWKIGGEPGTLKNPLNHYPHKNLEEFLKEVNYYTDIRAKELFEKRKKVNFLSIAVYPLVKFINNYFIKQGFRDGMEGLIFALTMSFHSFLVRGKLWFLWDKKKNS